MLIVGGIFVLFVMCCDLVCVGLYGVDCCDCIVEWYYGCIFLLYVE